MSVLSRDAERIWLGSCGVVAIWVTHPLCPFKVPRSVSCSAIVLFEVVVVVPLSAGIREDFVYVVAP